MNAGAGRFLPVILNLCHNGMLTAGMASALSTFQGLVIFRLPF
jgi:hypothetical protein